MLDMLLAIDPGADSGWAYFDSARRLKECGLGDSAAETSGQRRRGAHICNVTDYKLAVSS